MIDYDAIKRSPYYLKPKKEKSPSTRKRAPKKPKIGGAQDLLFKHIESVLAPKGGSLARLPGTRGANNLYVSINGKRCRVYHLRSAFKPRPECPSYTRISVSRSQEHPVDAHIISVALEGTEEVWYVIPAEAMTQLLTQASRTPHDNAVQVLNIPHPPSPSSRFEVYRDRWELVL